MLEKRVSQSALTCADDEDDFLQDSWRQQVRSDNEDAPDFVPRRPPVALRSVARQLSRRWAVLESGTAVDEGPAESPPHEFSFSPEAEIAANIPDLPDVLSSGTRPIRTFAGVDDEHYLRASGEINRSIISQQTEADAALLSEMWLMVNLNLSRSLREASEAQQQLNYVLAEITSVL
jgi:hypothetical protein